MVALALFQGASSLLATPNQVHQAVVRFGGSGQMSVNAIGGVNTHFAELRFNGVGTMSIKAIRKHPSIPRVDICVSNPRTDTSLAIARN